MTKKEFLVLMRFPPEWLHLGMYPDELWMSQLAGYKPGHEQAPEHDRNGAFHWWLSKEPDKQTLVKLTVLAEKDPDQIMADDVRNYILQAKSCDSEIELALKLKNSNSRTI